MVISNMSRLKPTERVYPGHIAYLKRPPQTQKAHINVNDSDVEVAKINCYQSSESLRKDLSWIGDDTKVYPFLYKVLLVLHCPRWPWSEYVIPR